MAGIFSTKSDEKKLRIELLSGEVYYTSEKNVSIDKHTGMVSFDSEEGKIWVPFTNVKKVVLLSSKNEEKVAVREAQKEIEIRAEQALAEGNKDTI